MLSATALLALYSIAGLDDASGGLLGLSLSQLFTDNFNLSGATLLLVAALLFGLTLYTGISWLGMMDRTGALTLRLMTALARRSLERAALREREPPVLEARAPKHSQPKPVAVTREPTVDTAEATEQPGAFRNLLAKVSKAAEGLSSGEAEPVTKVEPVLVDA